MHIIIGGDAKACFDSLVFFFFFLRIRSNRLY